MLGVTETMAKIIIGIVGALVVIVVGNFILPVQRAAIEVAAEPVFNLGGFVVTNALFTSALLSIFLVAMAAASKSNPAAFKMLWNF